MKKQLTLTLFSFVFTISQLCAQSWEIVNFNAEDSLTFLRSSASVNGNFFIGLSWLSPDVDTSCPKVLVYNELMSTWEHIPVLRTLLEQSNDSAFIRLQNLNDTALLVLVGGYESFNNNNQFKKVNNYYILNILSQKLSKISSFYHQSASAYQLNSLIKCDQDLYFPINLPSDPYADSTFAVARYQANGQMDTLFQVINGSYITFVAPLPDGFVFKAETYLTQSSGTNGHTYKKSTNTIQNYTMSAAPYLGVQHLNGALMVTNPFFPPNGIPNQSLVYYQEGLATQNNWCDPMITNVYTPLSYKNEVFFQTYRMVNGSPAYDLHKFVGPNVFAEIPYTEKFYSGSSESYAPLSCFDKDYLYARAGIMDSFVFKGLVRKKMLNTSNIAPQATNDTYSLTDTSSMVLTMRSNDTDANNDYLYAEIMQSGVGQAVLLPNYDIEYTPVFGFAGTDTIKYRAYDLGGLFSNVATIVLNVTSLSVPPVLQDDSLVVYKQVAGNIDVKINDDYQSEAIVLSIETAPTNGIASMTDGVIDYQPNGNYVGIDSLEYKACRTYNLCRSSKVHFSVQEHNLAPVCLPDFVTVDQTYNFVAPLANDTNTTGAGLTFTIVQGPFSPNALAMKFNETLLRYQQNNLSNFQRDSVQYEACNVSNVCSMEWVYFTNQNVGLDDENLVSFLIYPNPSPGKISIQYTEHFVEGSTIQLLDAQGRLLQTQTKGATHNEFDLTAMADGMYFIEVLVDGKTMGTQRFIKQE